MRKVLIDLGPLLAFFLTFKFVGLMEATAVLIVATLVASAFIWFTEKRIPALPLLTALIVLIFGGLTLALHDDTFIKIKPTIVNLLFSTLLFGSLYFKKPGMKLLFKGAFELPDSAWRILTWRWAIFFIVLAVANEVVWRSVSTDTWVTFKVFGILGATLVFTLIQLPFIHANTLKEAVNEKNAS